MLRSYFMSLCTPFRCLERLLLCNVHASLRANGMCLLDADKENLRARV
jgi:hypothetical protein